MILLLQKIRSALDCIAKVLEKIIVGFDVVAMAALVIVVTAQVVSRYVFNNSLTWSEELAKYITCYVIFLTTGYVLGNDDHVRIDLIYNKLNSTLKFVFDKFFVLCYFFFTTFVIKYGITYVALGKMKTASSMQWLRMDFVYVVVPISGILLAFYSLILLLRKKGDS